MIFFNFNKLYKKNKKNENNTFINHQNLVYLAILWEELMILI